MKSPKFRALGSAAACVLLTLIVTAPLSAQDISSSPSSAKFGNTYIGKASGGKVLTINKITSKKVTINSVSFDCDGFGLSSGIAPFTLGPSQTLTHYSVFFQPTTAKSYSCNFILSLNDGTSLKVPLTGTGLKSSAASSVTPSSLTFSNQGLGHKALRRP